MKIAAFFGGFRQDEPRALKAEFYRSFAIRRGTARVETHLNFSSWKSLSRRWKSARKFLSVHERLGSVEIAAYSMGVHLAVRFARSCSKRGAKSIRLTLVAPDPKYIESALDRRDQARNANAYVDAEEFWKSGVPGMEIERVLGQLGSTIQGVCVCSPYDPVAVWPGNVERFVDMAKAAGWAFNLNPAWVEDRRTKRIHETIFERAPAYSVVRRSRSR